VGVCVAFDVLSPRGLHGLAVAFCDPAVSVALNHNGLPCAYCLAEISNAFNIRLLFL
jgi:hypothetical protein